MRDGADVQFHSLTNEDVLRALDSRPAGLSTSEARERRARYGPNELRVAGPPPAWKILLSQLRSLVVLLLASAAAVSLLVGDVLDAGAIAVVLLINTVLGFTTEYRARRAIHALLELDVPRAVVRRDGTALEIDARELVPGDIIELDAGRAVPADSRLLDAAELRTNEAALTGESLPVMKTVAILPSNTAMPDRRNTIFKGTAVVAGSGHAAVIATGANTELGRIGVLVGGIAEERTPLEHRLDALGRRLAGLAALAGALVVGLGVAQGAELARMVETGIALAIAAVPEGWPAVATIALAVGVHRMARRNALVRRLPSVETLGSVTVVCTDKTGTLTAGEMTVTRLWTGDRDIHVSGTGYEATGDFQAAGMVLSPPEEPLLRDALRVGILANRAHVERDGTHWRVHGDPTEAALLIAGRKGGLERSTLLERWPEVGQVPFSSERMLMATFHRAPGGAVVAHVKGAPDRVLELCTRRAATDGDVPLADAYRRQIAEHNRVFASDGLRVLALARAEVHDTSARALRDLVFVALVGIVDPAAPGVRETIRLLRDAGIRTVMITGDQPRTAEAVARELGIMAHTDEVVTGVQLANLSAEDAVARMAGVSAYSRVTPEQKLQIVSAFQSAGDVVAMLGDGVNDAAALKKADVGVAMGLRGTDVAREVAAVVLQDDRFSTIGMAVEEGRVIFDNIRKFVFYLFSCNLAEVLVLLAAGIAGMPVPLTPLQILWLNMVTDTFPALALALEPGEADVMRRPPRDPARAILSRAFLRAVGFYAVLMAASSLAAFALGLYTGDSLPRAMTIGFMTLALAQTFHLGNARSTEQVVSPQRAFANPHAIAAVVVVVLLQLLAIYLPALAGLLGTVPLRVSDWLIVVPLALVTAVVGQTIDRLRR